MPTPTPHQHHMPTVRDFPSLIRWIADTYHRGAIMHVGEGHGISQATAAKWAAGRAVPTLEMLENLCAAYPVLDFHRVVDLVRAMKSRRVRAFVGLVVALALACVPAWAEAQAVDARGVTSSPSAPYRKRWFYQWLCVFPWPRVVMG